MTGKRKKAASLIFKFTTILVALGLVFYFPTLQIRETYAGVPKILSFQGRLTDASGNLLGGTGTNHYFKFSIYNAQTGGTKLWPTAEPSSVTIKVTQGVFNVLIGDTSISGFTALDLDFDGSSYYLRIDVSSDDSTFETLSPRQRMVASAFAINSDKVDGGSFLNTSGVGQFGQTATVAYSRFGSAITTHALSVSQDVLISGMFEVASQSFFNASASVSGSLELTSATSKLGLNAGNFINTAFEVGGTASISDTLTLAGGLTSNYTGSNSFAGSLDITKGLHVTGASTVANTFGIIKAISSAQLNIRQSSTVNAGFYVDSAGDLTLSTTGSNIRANDQNLWVCIGSCGATDPAEDGNVVVETGVIFDNNFKFKQSVSGASKSVTTYDSGSNSVFEFDEEQQ